MFGDAGLIYDFGVYFGSVRMDLSFFTCRFSWFVQGFEFKVETLHSAITGNMFRTWSKRYFWHQRDASNINTSNVPSLRKTRAKPTQRIVALDRFSFGEKRNRKGGFHRNILVAAWDETYFVCSFVCLFACLLACVLVEFSRKRNTTFAPAWRLFSATKPTKAGPRVVQCAACLDWRNLEALSVPPCQPPRTLRLLWYKILLLASAHLEQN